MALMARKLLLRGGEPLKGNWYGYEAENTFAIYNDSTLKETYSAGSRGMGRVVATFGTEFFLFHDGGSQIKWWNQKEQHGVLLTTSGSGSSLVCYDRNFVIVTHNGNTINAVAYVIAGTQSAPVAAKITETSIAVPSYTYIWEPCAARANETDAYVMEYGRDNGDSGYSYQTLKLVNNATYAPSLSLSWIEGRLWTTPTPVAGAWVATINKGSFWTPRMNYYVTREDNISARTKTFTVYRVSDNQKMFEHTYTNVGGFAPLSVRFFLDQDTGNGYVTTVGRTTSDIVMTLYRMNNWQQVQITQKVGGVTFYVYNTSPDGIFPLCDNKIPPTMLLLNTFNLRYKISFTTNSISAETTTVDSLDAFGSTTRWA